MDRLGEYDFKLVYRPSRDQHIGIADGLSRMPTRLTSISKAEDSDRMAMAPSQLKHIVNLRIQRAAVSYIFVLCNLTVLLFMFYLSFLKFLCNVYVKM